jgi:hypothetical protein
LTGCARLIGILDERQQSSAASCTYNNPRLPAEPLQSPYDCATGNQGI